MDQLAFEFAADTATNGDAEAQPETAVQASTATNGGLDQQGYMAMYQVDTAGDIPDAIQMFKNRYGIPARLLIWPGCDFTSSNGLAVETSLLMSKGWICLL